MPPEPQDPPGLRPVDAARLGTLRGVVRRLRHTLHYVDYRQAERLCEALASKLLESYPRGGLRAFAVRGIPRGGLIVLGMLSYMLDLRAEQLSDEPTGDRPLLLVDDCALSGARFCSALSASASSQVVFAHLYSHPDLRAAIAAREPRVERCVAAADLADHARELYGDDYPRWLASGRDHLGAGRYWLGLPDLVGFAWSEPDRPIWNPVSGALERGWRLLPPHSCLKARAELGPPPIPVRAATWRVADGVVGAVQEGRIWLYSLDTDRVYSLEGIGADMWRALASWGSVEAGAAHLAGRYEASRETLRRDLESFAETLAGQRLLEAAGGP
jgi:hypothetical protein